MMMGGSSRFRGTDCRSAAMVAPLASSGPVRCHAVLHGYGTSPLKGGGLYQLVTVRTHGNFIVLPHGNTMTYYPTQLHYPDTKRTSPRPILIIQHLASN